MVLKQAHKLNIFAFLIMWLYFQSCVLLSQGVSILLMCHAGWLKASKSWMTSVQKTSATCIDCSESPTSHQLYNKGSRKVTPEKEYHQKGPLILQINIDIHGDNYCNSRQIPAISAAVLGERGALVIKSYLSDNCCWLKSLACYWLTSISTFH